MFVHTYAFMQCVYVYVRVCVGVRFVFKSGYSGIIATSLLFTGESQRVATDAVSNQRHYRASQCHDGSTGL